MKKIKSRKFRLLYSKLFRGAMCFVMALVVFYCGDARAGMNDSLIEKNRKDGVYAIVEIDGDKRIFYLNMYEMNDRVAYCIELGVDITTEIYHSTNDFSSSYLTEEQIDYIRMISYYGYGYDGHDDYRYYMAAQEIIWEYLGNIDIEWTDEINVDGKRFNIDTYKENILKLVELDKEVLYLEWDNGQVYKVGDEIVLTDNSGLLENYEVVSVKHSDVSIDGNNLLIKVGNVIGEESIKLRKKDYYNYDSMLYYYGNSQRLISAGNYDRVEEEINFSIEGVSLNCIIVNHYSNSNVALGEGSLEGAVYDIYDEEGNLIDTYESDKTGRFTVRGLLLGSYQIVQVKASEGFWIPNGGVSFNVEVNQENLEVKLKQYAIIRSVQIAKVYGNNGNYSPEVGIEFYLISNDGKITGNLSTNSQGKIGLSLFYGSYNISQVSTTFGYSKVDDFVIDVKEGGISTMYYNLIDELVQVKIKINSLDSFGGDKLSLDGFSYRIKKKDEDSYLEFDGNNTFIADENGDVFVPGLLTYGDYVLEQVSVPKGVILNENVLEFSINDNSKLELIDGNLVMNVNFYNELVMGRVNVLTQEEYYYKNINEYGYEIKEQAGVEVKLYAKGDIIVNKKVIYNDGIEVYSGVTKEDGSLIIDNLYLGTYCLVNSETNEEKCFELVSSDNKSKLVEYDLEFLNLLDKSSMTIFNNSSDDMVIVGSMFEVMDSDGVVIYTGITNDDGIIKIDDLMVGDYCIKQKRISGNYKENNEEICVFLDKDSEIKFVNEKIVSGVIKVPNTLSRDIGLYEIFVVLIMIGTGYFVYKKIFTSKLYH